MHGLAVVPQSLLGESFRVAACLGTFRPSVAVAVKRDAFDAKPTAALPEFRGAVARADGGQIWEQRTFGGQILEHIQGVRAQVNQNRHAGFLARGTDGVVVPIHVLAFQAGDVALAGAEVPAQLIKRFRSGFTSAAIIR